MKRKTFKRTLLVMLGLIVLIVGMFAFLLFGPSVPIVVSTKTTYLTEPLDKYGRFGPRDRPHPDPVVATTIRIAPAP